MNPNLNKVVDEVSSSAQEYLDENHSSLALLKAAMNDFRSVGGMQGAIQFMSTGKLTELQVTKAKLMIAKVLAAVSKQQLP